MGRTLAIHWAQTTHGTWLHGDQRGSWREGRLIGPDPYLEAESRARMTHHAELLDAVERAIAARVFGDVVRERQHRVLAATIQRAHVHLIFGPLNEDVATVIARFKYRSAAAVFAHRRDSSTAETAGLRSEPAETAGLYSRAVSARRQTVPARRQSVPARRRTPRSLWTAGRFLVFIFNELHLTNAIEYVRDHNRRVGLPPDPYDWIAPLFPAGESAGERMNRNSVCEVVPW